MGQAFMSQFRISSPLRLRSDLHLTRKVWHISTGLIGLFFYKKSGISIDFMASALLTFAVAAFLFEFVRLRNEKINPIICKNSCHFLFSWCCDGVFYRLR